MTLSAVAASTTDYGLAQAPRFPWRTPEEAEEYAKDPRAFLMKRAEEWVDKFEPTLNHVYVVTYYSPQTKTLADGSKLYLPDNTTQESMYQGKVGLVVSLGPVAFDDPQFGGLEIEEGDWVVYRAADGWQLTMNGQHCRVLRDTEIRARVASPAIVY